MGKTSSKIRDPLAEALKAALAELVDKNIDGIAEKLATSPKGTLSVSFGAKLSLKGASVAATVKAGYKQAFDDSTEFTTKDPDQAELGIEGGAS